MPVDPKILEACIKEAAEGDSELEQFLRDRYSKNETLAAKFVGGFMRQSDYTRKSQEIADQRKTYESASAQLDATRKALEAAEVEKGQILKDLASHRISTAKAREMMIIMRDKFGLGDEDLPGMSDLIETAKKGKPVDTTEDLDTRLAKFGDDLMSRMEKKFVGAMMPELGAMANLPLVWNEIGREHQELTGKPLTFSEQQEILKGAQSDNKPLRQVWEEKYNIGGDAGLRMQKRDENLRKQWEQDREKADAEKRQKQALEVVTPKESDLGTGAGISPAFKTKFRVYETDPNKAPIADAGGVPSLEVKPGQHVRQTGDRGPTGAQRAAVKYLEKVASGGYGRKTA